MQQIKPNSLKTPWSEPTITPSPKRRVPTRSINTLLYTYIHKHSRALFKELKNITKPLSQLRAFLKMNFRKSTATLLIIFVIFAAILNHARVESSRVLSEDFVTANHLDTYSSFSIYEKAKHSMAYWLERLPSGPSPGAGH
jgi:hypothetical protein